MSAHVCVCFVSDDRFLPGTLVMLYSLLRSEPLTATYHFVAFHDAAISVLSDSSKNMIRAICPAVRFVPTVVDDYRRFPTLTEGAALSLLKFECFKLREYDAVVYFDTDLLVLSNVHETIIRLLSSGLSIAAVENTSRSRDYRVFSFESFPMNAGMFLYRPSDRYDLYSSLREVTRERLQLWTPFTMICQPILNLAFASLKLSYLALPCFYNFRDLGLFQALRNEVIILHYASRTQGNEKPWSVDDHMPASRAKAIRAWQDCARQARSDVPLIAEALGMGR